MSYTVVPLHNLELPPGSQIPFGTKFRLQDIPDRLRKDEHALNDLSSRDQKSFLKDSHALVAQYEADSYGHPDPDWKGVDPKGIQELRYQSAFLANIAIWLIQPSTLCFTNVSMRSRVWRGETWTRQSFILRSDKAPSIATPTNRTTRLQRRSS